MLRLAFFTIVAPLTLTVMATALQTSHADALLLPPRQFAEAN